MEKIRRLYLLLKAGIEDYEETVKTLQQERLKYLRLSMTDSFGADDNSSRASWLGHLKAQEMGLTTRLDALRQAVVNAAIEVQEDLPAKPPVRSETDTDKEIVPSLEDKV